MKKCIILMIVFLGGFSRAICQEYVFDPVYFESVTYNQVARSTAEETHNQYLGKIDNNLNTINLNVGSVVTAQAIIYNGLADVNSALKDGLAVKNMAVLTGDMISYLQQCLSLAKSEPYLLLFATGIEHEMQLRALALVSDVSAYVLKKGDNVLADYNARDQLLKKITMQLQIIDSLAYGAWRAMFWANERGIFASLNPWQNFVNQDKLFVQQIIGNAKYLKANP